MTREFLFDYFRELRLPLIFAVSTFGLGIIIGVVKPHYFAFLIRYVSNMGVEAMRQGRLILMVTILAQNLMAFLILIVAGGFLGIVPTLALLINGAVVGAVFRLSGIDEISHLFFHIIPHGIFELPAYLICAAISLHCGRASLSRLGFKEIIGRYHLGTRIFLRTVFPLLILAAFIEAFISSSIH